MFNEKIEKLENSLLEEMNEIANLKNTTPYDTHRYMFKTRVSKTVFNTMIEKARQLSLIIQKEKTVGNPLYDGYNENYPFDVLTAYFRV